MLKTTNPHIMKKLLAASAAFLLVYSAHAQTQNSVKDIDKMVQVTNGDYDMGKIPSHKPQEFTVTIKNIGKDTIILKEVKAGCGCTTPKYRGNEVILPGKSTFIILGFNGDAAGAFEKTADIYFNDGNIVKQVKFRGIATQNGDSTRRSAPVYRR